MPIRVDREERRVEIIEAAILELGESGYDRFSLKNVGRRLGGSVTLVTHYFSSRSELFTAMLEYEISEAREFLVELEAIEDPQQRARQMIAFFVPASSEQVAWERARVGLSIHAMSNSKVSAMFGELDPSMREVVRVGLQGLVPDAEMSKAIDLVRLWSSGLVLLILEQPGSWDSARTAIAISSLQVSLNALGSEITQPASEN